MDKVNFLLVSAFLMTANASLRIVDLKVPSTIESGSNNEVILDCDFEAKDEAGLEVKWFYDSGEEQIYQWIPHRTKPQALGFLKDRIDLEYRASNDSGTMYRALRIKDITSDLSGEYTCKVTSFYNEDTATKKMIIYEAAKEFEFVHLEDTNQVVCTASGVFPEPKINIYILGLNSTLSTSYEDDDNDNDDDEDDSQTKNEESSEDEDEVEKTEDNAYNATSIFTYDEDILSGVTTFVCEIWIPDTTYKLRKTLDMYSGSISGINDTLSESNYNETRLWNQENSNWSPKSSNFVVASGVLLLVLMDFDGFA